MTEIPSPFQKLNKDQFIRTTINFPIHVKNEIVRVECKTGVIQATIDVLINKFYEQLKQRNLETSNRASYHAALNNCTISLGGDDNAKRSTAIKSKARSKSPKSVETTSGNE